MFFEKPLLGKVYEDDCFLTSGMLYENSGRVLLELHNEGANPESDYFGQDGAWKRSQASRRFYSFIFRPYETITKNHVFLRRPQRAKLPSS